jgi:hypothetical protein
MELIQFLLRSAIFILSICIAGMIVYVISGRKNRNKKFNSVAEKQATEWSDFFVVLALLAILCVMYAGVFAVN